jgi:hypothetical protein
MFNSRIKGILAIIIVSVLAGCGPPRPPQPVNARLPGHSPPLSTQPAATKADTCILAQCKQQKEYAETVKGDWITYWYLSEWEVIRVIQGKWESPNLLFILTDKWPTPESGIMLSKMPLPYWEDRAFQFWLDTSKKVPVIVAQQERSRIPPHGPIKRPSFNLKDPESKKRYERVTDAAARFIMDKQGKVAGLHVAEELDNFFIVENLSRPQTLAVMVDKDTYEVRCVHPLSE